MLTATPKAAQTSIPASERCQHCTTPKTPATKHRIGVYLCEECAGKLDVYLAKHSPVSQGQFPDGGGPE